MHTRKLLICIAVLILTSLACQFISGVAGISEATAPPPTVPAPLPTDTSPAPEPTPTQPPPPSEPPPTAGSAPVIQSVDLRDETSGGEMTVYMDISFLDADGDANLVDYSLVSATTDGLTTEDGVIDTPPEAQKSGATITGTWNCGDGNYEATISIVLSDKAGNKSQPSEFTIVCGSGALQGGFPDPFDDNRNGWGVGDYVSIQDGMLQFRNVPADQSIWVWCDNCIVTPEQDSLSVEGSWANSADSSLGLLIDDKVCTPDGLAFLIGPHGYYTIIQAVRDDAGNWSHWRPFIDWTKSEKIRKAQNQPNLISAVYEFGDNLHVTLSVNGTYIIRVEVFGYNGAKECRPGLFGDAGLDSNFDNFSIPEVK